MSEDQTVSLSWKGSILQWPLTNTVSIPVPQKLTLGQGPLASVTDAQGLLYTGGSGGWDVQRGLSMQGSRWVNSLGAGNFKLFTGEKFDQLWSSSAGWKLLFTTAGNKQATTSLSHNFRKIFQYVLKEAQPFGQLWFLLLVRRWNYVFDPNQSSLSSYNEV